jgi:outer membrane translocation and assembly module TamA
MRRQSGLPNPVVLLTVALVLLPVAARAQAAPRADGLDVGRVEVVGVPADLGAFPREGLALAPRRKLFGTTRATLTQRKVDLDRERIVFYLAQRGYPDAVVTASAEVIDGGKRARVTFTVEPGPPVRFANVAVTGMPESLAKEATSRAEKAVVRDARFDQGVVESLRAELLDLLHEAGYVQPDLQVKVQRATPGMADVLFVAVSGPSFVFGDVTVTGVPPDLTALSERVIGIEPGDPCSASRLRDMRLDLRELNLFRQIDVATTRVEPDTLDLDARLSLQAMNSWELSLGTWTDEWIRVRAGWTNRNLFKRGRSLRLEAAYSPHNIEGLARTSWPALLLRKSRTDLDLSYNVDTEDNYTQTTAEAEIAALFYFTRKTTFRLGLAFSVDDVDEGTIESHSFFGTNPGLTPLLRARLYRDAVDHPIEPRAGYRAALSAEWSPPFSFSENPFLWVRGYGSWYRGLGAGTVVAARLDFGAAEPLGTAAELLPSNRFFAGGASTMRGYKRHRLGPVDETNEAVGGEVLALAGAEVRQIMGSLGTVPVGLTVFFDSGQVWASRDLVRLDDIVAALGLGVWVRTPIGPIRVDVAQNLGNTMHGDPKTVYHFAIGYAY